jgi:PAS domain S-box-containing protein
MERAGLFTAIEQSADAIAITDTSGTIQYVNAAFTGMTGYSRDEAVGQHPRLLKSGQHSPAFYKNLWETISSGRIWHDEVINRRKDGTVYTEQMRITPVRNSAGEIVSYIAVKQDVTERRAAEEARGFLAAIVESSDDAIIAFNPEGVIRSWNRAAEIAFGHSAAEAIGQHMSLIVAPDRLPRLPHFIARIMQGDAIKQYESICIRRDGRELRVSVTGSPIRNRAGGAVAGSVIIRDISDRHEAERKLLESEERFRGVFEHAPLGMFVSDKDGHIKQVNAALCAMLGYSEPELLAKTWLELVHPEDLALSLQKRAQLWNGQVGFVDGEGRYIHRTGSVRWARLRASLVRESAGKPLFSVIHVEDITERKRTEEALRESEERFRIMADGCPAPMWVSDAEGERQFINRAYREIRGVTCEQVKGEKWQMLIHPDDAPEYIEAFQRAVREHVPFKSESRVRGADGEWRWFASYAEPRFSSAGEFLGHVGLSPDITERKQAEQTLRGSEEKFRQLAEHIHEVFWMMNPASDEILYISPAYEAVWGRTCESLYQKPTSWAEAIHPDDLEGAHALFARQIQGERVDSEYRIRTPDGEEKWIRDRAFPIRAECGELIRVVGIAEDITERKRYETELVSAREGADAANVAKSRFLANMSHEIRTPMNGVLGMLQLLLLTDLTPEQRKYADMIGTSGHALLTLIDDILDLSRIEAHKLTLAHEDFSLSRTLENAGDTLRSLAHVKGLAFNLRVAPETPALLRGDGNRLRQVLINLAGNAIKFTERGGVTVDLAVERQDATTATLHFSVGDSGIGILPEQASALFCPFVQADASTTRKYGGTGLGLAISKQLVEMMGGKIGFESQPGRGSTFWFTAVFEKSSALAPASLVFQSPAKQPIRPRRDGRILVAEDNPCNQLALTGLLKNLGYHVTVVANGCEALAELHCGKYDLVLMDCRMPVMDGFKATRRIRASGNGNMPIIAVTADAMEGDRERCIREGMNDYLSKPVDARVLAEVLEKWLDGKEREQTI